jgi:hypothetical protein
MKCIRTAGLIGRWTKDDKVYVGEYRIKNPQDPPSDWVLSKKASPNAAKIPVVLVQPESFDDAVTILKSVHAAGLIFSDEPVIDPFPFGPTWTNLADHQESWATWSAKAVLRGIKVESSNGTLLESVKGLLGHTIQDGSKFSSSTYRNTPNTLKGVVLEKAWLYPLSKSLNALLLKTSDWHTGRGVFA